VSYLLYSFLYGGFLLLGLPYFLYRSAREPGFGRSLLERFRGNGQISPATGSIWIHAVSVGEAVTAGTLVPRLRQAFPETRLVLSVTTPTARRVALEKLPRVDDVFHCPFDLAFVVRRVMHRVRPRALIVIETEIWPHLFREARRAGAATLLVNGRISDRSFPGYLRIRFFLARYLATIDRFLMQNDLYADRIAALGAPREKIRIVGSLKFDAPSASSSGPHARVSPPGRTVLIGGSTLDPEEGILLSVFERLRRSVRDLFLVLAPRHASRFEAVFDLARRRGMRVVKRSTAASTLEADVLVLDTLGELASVYEEADYVFVGGSLAPWGGHNIIEPASQGKPVLFGPHMQNFSDIARLFLDANAAIQVGNEDELERALLDLVKRPERRQELASNAARVIEENRGAADRTVAALQELLRP
jgi:3-deoxy-D-manno-octulosonic-acid transferase